MKREDDAPGVEREIELQLGDGGVLRGDLCTGARDQGLVLFAHGSGSSRKSPRNRAVARELRAAGFATLLLDLLTPVEEAREEAGAMKRFDVELLARRLELALDRCAAEPGTAALPLGLFGASTGAAAALLAAADRAETVRAVVSRGGRPDLAGPALPLVRAPTLAIVGGADPVVLELNRAALARMSCERELAVVPGATHLFEEPGTLEEVARLAALWFRRHLAAPRS